MKPKPSYLSRQGLLLALLLSFLLSACEEADNLVRVPARELYHDAVLFIETDAYSQAQEKLQKLIEENPGTQLTTFAHLRMAEIHMDQAKWLEAEAHYRSFLALNPKSHLAQYVLSRLIELNYKRNYQGFFFKTRDYDRDMEPNRKIILDYERFYLLYPQSVYLQDVKGYLGRARSHLAEHERMVGDFYFRYQAYDSAILRYLYLLRNYPEFPETHEVGLKLIEAYKKNQQPHLAKEMKRALSQRFEN